MDRFTTNARNAANATDRDKTSTDRSFGKSYKMKTEFNADPSLEQPDGAAAAEAEASAEARGLALVHVPRDRAGLAAEPPPPPFNVWTIAGALR